MHRFSMAADCQSLAAASCRPWQKGADTMPPLLAVSRIQPASWSNPTSCMHRPWGPHRAHDARVGLYTNCMSSVSNAW